MKPVTKRQILILRSLLLIVGVFALASCNFTTVPQGEFTPTFQDILASNTPPPAPTLTPITSTLPSLQVESPTPTETPAPPTETLTPSSTPGPYEHTVTQGDSLITIVQQYGYTDLTVGRGGIIDQVVILNGLPSADILPPPGSNILIPRQTTTPTPENSQTEVAVAVTDAASSLNVTLRANAAITQYNVAENDTLIGIAQANNLTLAQIVTLNPDLNIFGCNFEIPSGGPDCNIPLRVGQVINLPAPTPTPTLSPTPSGSETATPTPTYVPPMLIAPPNGATAPPGVFSLQWVSVGILAANESYLIEVTDMTSGSIFRRVTKDTSLLLPDSLIPTDGQTHTFNWTVRVASPNDQGIYHTIGGAPEIRIFSWQSR